MSGNVKQEMLEGVRKKVSSIFLHVKVNGELEMKKKMFTYIYRIFKNRHYWGVSLYTANIYGHPRI